MDGFGRSREIKKAMASFTKEAIAHQTAKRPILGTNPIGGKLNKGAITKHRGGRKNRRD